MSTAFCAEIVESADAYLFAGPIFNDYSSVGYSFLLKKEKAVIVLPDRVTIGNDPAFGCIMMKDFLFGAGQTRQDFSFEQQQAIRFFCNTKNYHRRF